MRDRRTRLEQIRRQRSALLLVCSMCSSCHAYDAGWLDAIDVKPMRVDAGSSLATGRSAAKAPTAPGASDGGSAPMRRSRATMVPPTATTTPMDRDDPPAMDAGERLDADLADRCPDDVNKTEPQQCGCGIAESCSGLIAALAHRYRFEGVGLTLIDTRGGAHGETSSPLMGTSALTLSGNAESYGTLPAGLLSDFSAVTIELWLTWFGGAAEQQALSFGTAAPTEPSSMCSNAELWRGSWYRFCMADGTTSWWKARGLCEGAGGALAAIESGAEQEHIVSNAAFTESAWIGATDLQVEGQWYFANAKGLQGGAHFWSGDERGSAPSGAYQAWRRDEAAPNDSDANADCAFIFNGNRAWTAYACDNDGSFVCEWRGHQGRSLVRGLAFTPADTNGLPTMSVKLNRQAALVIQGEDSFPEGKLTQVAIVLDGAAGKAAFFIAGKQIATAATSGDLSTLTDLDNWLGRSHIASAPGLSGALTELRVYNRALTAEELTTSHLAGPDPQFLE